MKNFSVLIGGKAGSGIDTAALIIAKLFNQLGYNIYIYRDYPSVIRGGHTFAIIRASIDKISAHEDKVDFILALNQDTMDRHQNFIKDTTKIIYDADSLKTEGIAVFLQKVLKEMQAPRVMRNSIMIGAFAKIVGIDLEIVKDVFKKRFTKDKDTNLKVATRGYEDAKEVIKIEKASDNKKPIITGNDAVSLGFLNAGIDSYISYPMTPSSAILHFLAKIAHKFNLKVLHPESEISAIIMALGFAAAGKKVATGTSGGGYCLMTEGISFAAMAELPVVVVLGQRPGPATGLPTYSGQSELNFALYSAHGEFSRFVVAPADPEEAYYWSSVALNMAWKYQIPSIILTDKALAEGVYSFDKPTQKEIKEFKPTLWDKKDSYKRYKFTENGVSPLAFYSDKNAVIKINSYEHDEFGVTTEDAKLSEKMQEKRVGKEKYLKKDLEDFDCVNVYGNKDSKDAILCWGSNKGVCIEAAEKLNLKVIHPIVMHPFPEKQFKEAMKNVKTLISVELNVTGQLANLIKSYGFKVDKQINKYDGRPFTVEELIQRIKKVK
ncbi:MAG: 2-oxoglutarate oxidoreductase subunit KorA [Candidatus Anoxychlamydiales bacterium]|nr:2-oxoglutarate oxidoreductase subunit KorA [Candidatus Anoxychlamydiales bacterium]